MPSNKKVHAGRSRPPQSIDTFATRVHGLHEAVRHGDEPLQAADALRKGWMLLDPLTSNVGAEAADRRPRLAAALGKAVEVVGQVPSKQLKGTKLREMGRHLLLDQAATEIRLPQVPKAASANLQRVLESTERQSGQESRFDALSAKAMLLHLKSRELADKPMESWRRSGSNAILKASLGGLVKESVAGVRELNNEYHAELRRGATGSLMSGRAVEAMRFTYELMKAYKIEGSLASKYPRFSVFREDRPAFMTTPRRSFDIAVTSADHTVEPELVQVKSGHEPQYAPGITVWSPNTNVVHEADAVVSWFDTLVDNEATDAHMNEAWRNLTERFEPSPTS